MVLTIDIPDELATRIASLPSETINRHTIAALTDLADEYADTVTAIREGLEDVAAGHTISLDEYAAEVQETRRQRNVPQAAK